MVLADCSLLLQSIAAAILAEAKYRSRQKQRLPLETFLCQVMPDHIPRICRRLSPMGLDDYVLTHHGEIIDYRRMHFTEQVHKNEIRRVFKRDTYHEVDVNVGIEMTQLNRADGSLISVYSTVHMLLSIFYGYTVRQGMCALLRNPNACEIADLINNDILVPTNITLYPYSEYFTLEIARKINSQHPSWRSHVYSA